MLTVPLAVLGALLALFGWGTLSPLFGGTGLGATLNLYSQIGIVIPDRHRHQERHPDRRICQSAARCRSQYQRSRGRAAILRLRPILMTSLSTAIGAMPLVLASGAGANSRFTIGLVIVAGVSLATLLTLFVVPSFYRLLAGYTRSPRR